jgi:hypothetical protein
MFSDLSPQFPYYLLLFFLTVVLRFIRAYRSHPKDQNGSGAGKYWTHYFYFGFELVNVSAGVFILLSEQAASYVATFMILYVILVVISFFLEDEGVGQKLKLWGNILISIAVVSVTCYAFLSFDRLKVDAKSNGTKAEKTQSFKWLIALPYIDASLNRNFASKNEVIRNIYIVQTTSQSS